MKIRILGAGPAGLYFAALMKRLDPAHDIAIFDRNPRGATFGFGVVFSDRALEFLRADDEALYQYLTPHLVDHAEVRRRDPKLAAAYEALHPEVLPLSPSLR